MAEKQPSPQRKAGAKPHRRRKRGTPAHVAAARTTRRIGIAMVLGGILLPTALLPWLRGYSPYVTPMENLNRMEYVFVEGECEAIVKRRFTVDGYRWDINEPTYCAAADRADRDAVPLAFIAGIGLALLGSGLWVIRRAQKAAATPPPRVKKPKTEDDDKPTIAQMRAGTGNLQAPRGVAGRA